MEPSSVPTWLPLVDLVCEDEEFLFRKLPTFQFLIVTLHRPWRAALLATHVASVADKIHDAIADFDAALPRLATLRDVGEHIDDYALDGTHRHHRTINRRMLQVAAWDDSTYHWLDIDFDPSAAPPTQQLFNAARDAHRDFTSSGS